MTMANCWLFGANSCCHVLDCCPGTTERESGDFWRSKEECGVDELTSNGTPSSL